MSIHYECKQKSGSVQEKAGCILFLIFLVIISVSTSGCIKLIQQSTGSNNIHTQEELYPDPVRTVAPASSINPAPKNLPPQPTLSVTPTTPGLVTDAAPILPADPYPIQHATQINETPRTNHHVRYAEFTRTYVLRGNATGLVVNATELEGPLWISFYVKPLYDCLENPESCRGEPGKSISRPYFTLTVRDNRTREIVAEDGYGREYSSQRDNRTIKIYGEGQYHLTLTGNSIDVTLAVATRAAPPAPETQSSTTSPSPARTLPPEYLRYLRESGGAV